jgi:hypothetical protein
VSAGCAAGTGGSSRAGRLVGRLLHGCSLPVDRALLTRSSLFPTLAAPARPGALAPPCAPMTTGPGLQGGRGIPERPPERHLLHRRPLAPRGGDLAVLGWSRQAVRQRARGMWVQGGSQRCTAGVGAAVAPASGWNVTAGPSLSSRSVPVFSTTSPSRTPALPAGVVCDSWQGQEGALWRHTGGGAGTGLRGWLLRLKARRARPCRAVHAVQSCWRGRAGLQLGAGGSSSQRPARRPASHSPHPCPLHAAHAAH